jgi:hypothetical protein
MKRSVVAVLLVIGVATTALEVRWSKAHAADGKLDLIDKIIPKDIKALVEVGQSIASAYSGIMGAVDVLKGIGVALGILEPANAPDQFATLAKHLDEIAGALDWKISAVARDNRYGQVMASFYELMHSMQSDALTAAILANADHASLSTLKEVEGPEGSAFTRIYREDATAGDWTTYFDRRPDVSNGEVYDWRIGMPELMQYIGIRIQVIAALDANFKSDGQFRTELDSHRNFLLDQLHKIDDGVICRIIDQGNQCGAANPSCLDTASFTTMCADIYTGMTADYVSTFQSSLAPDALVLADVRRLLTRQMPIFEIKAMINTLYAYNHPEKEEHAGALSIAANGGCLDAQWGSSDDGTPVWIYSCDFSHPAAQTWQYDRQKSRIYNPSFDKCLDVSNASTRAGAQVQVWSCNGSDAQRWTWDPETRTFENGLGTVLDGQDRGEGSDYVVTAERNAQHWTQMWSTMDDAQIQEAERNARCFSDPSACN